MTVTNILKNVVLGVEEKPDKDSLLFVNISYDKMLIPRYDTDGFESGNVAITDRMALSRFLKTINERQEYRFIILDVFFEDSTSYDSMLQAQVKNTKALVLPYHFDGGEARLKSYIKGWSGLADYNTDFGTFLKYSYIQHDTSRTVPLLLYEKFNKGYLRKSGPFYTSNGHLALNALTLDFPVRSFDVFTNDDGGYSSVHLCELMNTPPDFINALTKNKIIVIGDFVDRDLHATLYGTMAGPLIQLNAYLALVNGDHLLTWPLLIFIFSAILGAILFWFFLLPFGVSWLAAACVVLPLVLALGVRQAVRPFARRQTLRIVPQFQLAVAQTQAELNAAFEAAKVETKQTQNSLVKRREKDLATANAEYEATCEARVERHQKRLKKSAAEFAARRKRIEDTHERQLRDIEEKYPREIRQLEQNFERRIVELSDAFRARRAANRQQFERESLMPKAQPCVGFDQQVMESELGRLGGSHDRARRPQRCQCLVWRTGVALSHRK